MSRDPNYNVHKLPKQRTTILSYFARNLALPISILMWRKGIFITTILCIAVVLIVLSVFTSIINWWKIAEFIFTNLELVGYTLTGVIIISALVNWTSNNAPFADLALYTFIAVIFFGLPSFIFNHITTPGNIVEYIFLYFEVIMYGAGITLIIISTILKKADYLLEREWVIIIFIAVFAFIIPTYMLSMS